MFRSSGLDLVDARDPHVERIWRALEAHTQPSYFLSWGFIKNWLAALPDDELPSLAVVVDGGEPAAAFFLAQRRTRRNLVRTNNALYFNATGSPRHDELGIEHNGMLAAPGARRSLAAVLDLIPGEWDELFLPAVDRYAFDDLGAGAAKLSMRYEVHIEREATAPFVDLEAVRTVDGGYDALLSTSARTQLQRSRSLVGNVDLDVATDEREAMAIYGELLRIGAKRRPPPGVRNPFADASFERFHRGLIHERLRHGEIQLLRVRSGDTTLGCLYNVVYRGRVIFYQCGIASFDDANLNPGYLCHAAAVEYNALAGHSFYDLLGGNAHHRLHMATGKNRRVWLRVRRPAARRSLQAGLQRWYERLLGERPNLALSPA
jgi:CelD/BcsL family acetyltransferase involved in cellulose biosynthesis